VIRMDVPEGRSIGSVKLGLVESAKAYIAKLR